MNVRKLALDAINTIIDKEAFSNIIVNEYLGKYQLSDADKGLFTNLVYGTIQHMLTISYYLEPFIKGKKVKRFIKHLLYLSVYQLVYLKTAEYAVVNEATEIAKAKDRHLASFVNGVLRNFIRTPLREIDEKDSVMYLSIRYSHPAWLVAYLLKDYKKDVVEKILIENSLKKDDAIRVNTLKITKQDVINELNNNGIPHSESDAVENGIVIYESVLGLDIFKDGKITIQDISSQMVSEVVNPNKNSNVLDLCSAPGGKTAHLAALMNNTGKIFACDIYEHKIKLMEQNFKRLGVTNVVPQLVDARRVKNHVDEESFDYVLADVPCSGLGVLSHKVDLKYRIDKKSIDEIVVLQKEILDATKKLVKVNGYYIYSTCTINKDENEKQIRKFLKENPNFEKVFEKQILPFENHSDGFYICKLKRVER